MRTIVTGNQSATMLGAHAVTRATRATRATCLAAGAVLAVACGGRSNDATAVSDDLRRDLELASAASVALPDAAPRTRFVSPIERVPDPAPRAPSRDRSPARTPTRARSQHAPARVAGAERGDAAANEASHVHEAPAPQGAVEPVATPVADAAPAPAADAPAPEVHEPEMGAGTAEAPSGPSADTGRGRGIGDAIGGVIGVVIRGGAVGEDHCERDRPGRGRIPYPVAGVGGPFGGPMIGRGTFGGSPFPVGGGRRSRVAWPR